MNRLKPHISFANITSVLALFVALGLGTAYAAEKIGSKDIARQVIKSKHVQNDSLRGKDIAPDSLKGRDIEEASLDGYSAVAFARVTLDDQDAIGLDPADSAGVQGVAQATFQGKPLPGTYCFDLAGDVDPRNVTATRQSAANQFEQTELVAALPGDGDMATSGCPEDFQDAYVGVRSLEPSEDGVNSPFFVLFH